VYELLECLHGEGRDLGIVSANTLGLTDILVRNKIHPFFDVVVTGSDVAHKKPHREGIDMALQMLRGKNGNAVRKENAVMVGDTAHDLGAARNAGIHSILFYPDNAFRLYRREELESYGPKHIVGSHSRLKEILKQPA
jgi:phosphoglycolate phosphatase-like HAD superfamily hydrolase